MSKWIKLDPSKPFVIPEGFRLGKVIVNGECKERTIEVFENTTRNDDNQFIRKLQKTMYYRSIECINKNIKK
jgi:hypothetical protein